MCNTKHQTTPPSPTNHSPKPHFESVDVGTDLLLGQIQNVPRNPSSNHTRKKNKKQHKHSIAGLKNLIIFFYNNGACDVNLENWKNIHLGEDSDFIHEFLSFVTDLL